MWILRRILSKAKREMFRFGGRKTYPALFSNDAVVTRKHALPSKLQHGRNEALEEQGAVGGERSNKRLGPGIIVQILIGGHDATADDEVHVVRSVEHVGRLQVHERLQVERGEVRRRAVPRAEVVQLLPERRVRKLTVRRWVVAVREIRAVNLPYRVRTCHHAAMARISVSPLDC